MIEFTAIILLAVSFATVVFFGAYIAYRLVVLIHEWINKGYTNTPEENRQIQGQKWCSNHRVIPDGFWHTVRAWDHSCRQISDPSKDWEIGEEA